MNLANLFEKNLPLRKGVIDWARSMYGALVCVMRPEDFIRLTTASDEHYQEIFNEPFSDLDAYRTKTHPDYNVSQYNMPFLYVEYPSGRVTGHEGRHRAAMVSKAGGKSYPCIMVFYQANTYTVTYEKYNPATQESEYGDEPFADRAAAEARVAELKHLDDTDPTFYYYRIQMDTNYGGKMKGSPRSNPDKWHFTAWKTSDVPPVLIGEYNESVHIPTSSMRFGVVKGYSHYKKPMTEAPVGDWQVDPNFDQNEKEMISKFTGYENDTKHWPDADKLAIRDPGHIKKVQGAFLKAPANFNIYFWQSKIPDYDPTLEKGLVSPEWVQEHMGETAFNFVSKSMASSAITIIMTNNLSDENYMSIRSPWMFAHRISHSLIGAGWKDEAGGNAYHAFDEFVEQVLKIGYGLYWPDQGTEIGSIIRKDYFEVYTKMMGHFIGTMRSARTGKLVQRSEWKHETFAQWLLTGKVTLRPLPQHFDEGLDLTTDPHKLAKVQKLWQRFPMRLDRIFRKVLEDAKGKIWVI